MAERENPEPGKMGGINDVKKKGKARVRVVAMASAPPLAELEQHGQEGAALIGPVFEKGKGDEKGEADGKAVSEELKGLVEGEGVGNSGGIGSGNGDEPPKE